MPCSLLAIKFQEGKRPFPWRTPQTSVATREERGGGGGGTPQHGVGCCWGAFLGGRITLTVCSSGAKGAERREQKGPRLSGAGTSEAAWKVAWGGSQPRVVEHSRVLRDRSAAGGGTGWDKARLVPGKAHPSMAPPAPVSSLSPGWCAVPWQLSAALPV